jgi:hypothetical protein
LLVEAVGDLEGAAVQADVLAEDEDALVALHLLLHALTEGLEVSDLRHLSPLSVHPFPFSF